MGKPAFLIVNADDYGFSKSVSRGILDAAGRGIVTATGILANSAYFAEHAKELRLVDTLDAGVHLNLTAGRPLTERIGRFLAGNGDVGTTSKFRVARWILSGRISLDIVEEEWEAQIRRCLDTGLRLWFLNSHEHLHMLPPLFRLIHRLADRHGIPYLRYPSSEWLGSRTPESIARVLALSVLDLVNAGTARRPAPMLLGAGKSGKLDLQYIEKRLSSLQGGHVYELMCHPGYHPMGDISDRRLLDYHDWEGELNALRSAEELGLFRSEGVTLIGFRDIEGTCPSQA